MPKTRPLISVVDDDESMREAIRGLMKSLGYTAEAFASAEDFLNSRQVPRTSCLIADVQMPGMTGLEMLPKVKELRPDVPVIMITAYGDADTRRKALDNGATGLLTKPIDFALLRQEIDSRLGQAA